MISEYAVRSYFGQARSRGWGLVSGSLADGWHALFKGRLRDYDVYLDVAEQWVYMQCPLLRSRANDACTNALYAFLLKANDRLFLAKFTLISGGRPEQPDAWVALTVDCPADRFDASVFRLMTDSIATYSEEYVREIEVLAYDEAIAHLITTDRWQGDAPLAVSGRA